jgi:hypothetical protein
MSVPSSAKRWLATGLLAVLATLPVAAALAAAPRPPDLSGFWNLSRAKVTPDPDLMRRVAPDTAVLEDTGAAEFGTLEFGGLKLKAAALERAKAWKAADDMTISNACRIPSIVYAMQGPFPIEIFQGTELIVMKMEYFDMVRVIHMDGRADMAADAPHTKEGFSRGHWERDVLVVETTHLKEATITNNGLEHSRNIRVLERFKLSPDGKQLWATQEFADPEVLDNRGVRFIVWTKTAGDHVHAYDCDPSFAEEYNRP